MTTPYTADETNPETEDEVLDTESTPTHIRSVDAEALIDKLHDIVLIPKKNDAEDVENRLGEEIATIIDWLTDTPRITDPPSKPLEDSEPNPDAKDFIAVPVTETGCVRNVSIDVENETVEEINRAPNQALRLDERIRYLCTLWRLTNHHDNTQHHAALCGSQFNKLVDRWNEEKLYEDDEPIKRLITALRNEIDSKRSEHGSSTDEEDVWERCLTQIEAEITVEETRLNNEKRPNDDVTLIVEYEQEDVGEDTVVGGVIIEPGDDAKIRRDHDELRDHTEIRHTTRSDAEEFLTEHGIEYMY